MLVPVYYKSKQPAESRKVVYCDQCQDWFHDDCVNVPNIIWKGDKISWFSKACIK